jgi:hypothetical protein
VSGWLITEKAAGQLLDIVGQLAGRQVADLVESLIAQNGSPVVDAAVQWCWFYGGTSPDEAAGMHCEDDEGRATDMPQWLVDGGAAWRPVAFGPWVVQPRDEEEEPCSPA